MRWALPMCEWNLCHCIGTNHEYNLLDKFLVLGIIVFGNHELSIIIPIVLGNYHNWIGKRIPEAFFHLFRYGMMVQLWSHLLIFNVNRVGPFFCCFQSGCLSSLISRKSTPMTFTIFHWLSVSPTSNNTTHAIYIYTLIVHLSTIYLYLV